MIVYSKERRIPNAVNMLCLEGKDGGFYYIHRSLYDQAVVLFDKYAEDRGSLKYLICGKDYASCDFFFNNAPEPINILGDYLGLLESPPSDEEDIELLCGILHVISMNLSFKKIIKVPASVRLQIRFSLSCENEYSQSWDMFYIDSIDYEAFLDGMLPNESGSSGDSMSEEDALRELFSDTDSLDLDLSTQEEEEEEKPKEPEKRIDPIVAENGDRPSKRLAGW